MEFNCFPAGDKAILVQFKQEISEEINRKVIKLARKLEEKHLSGVEELVPAYASLLVYYNPIKIRYYDLINEINSIEINEIDLSEFSAKVHEIPVLYGGAAGQDLKNVADYHGLTVEEVISIHSGTTYRVYMLGFAPGFPYLGGLDPRLHTPRLKSPRIKIPAGSIGIAGQQTGIYPLSTPGGWRIIGHTPISLFRPNLADQPVLISAGDLIRFVPISEKQYIKIQEELISDIP